MTEAEIRDQLAKLVDVLQQCRAHIAASKALAHNQSMIEKIDTVLDGLDL